MPLPLPGDSHVHSEWSWDAPEGSMELTCARAVALGLPGVAFTEHLDHTAWRVTGDDLATSPVLAARAGPDGVLTPPVFDAVGYLGAVERCRELFPGLRILSGLEVGEPHRHAAQVAAVLSVGRFDRVLGSLHALPDRGGFAEPPGLLEHREPGDVLGEYLAEIPRLVAGSDVFAVFAHIDYPVRFWPATGEPFDPYIFEGEFRQALRSLADGDRVLEVNTRLPLRPEIVRWWREEGGAAVSFGSDAHLPAALAAGFREAVHMVEAHGFRPGRTAEDFWRR